MEKQEVRAVIKYFYFKGLTPQEIFTDMKETLGESAPAYSTVTKWYAEYAGADSPNVSFISDSYKMVC